MPFQSTPSAWRETSLSGGWYTEVQNFNPLPPHGGRHIISYRDNIADPNFNPLPPHGGRRFSTPLGAAPLAFQSTPSAWRETAWDRLRSGGGTISIHSLRMEGDESAVRRRFHRRDFNPLPPHGGRHGSSTVARQVHSISIHSLRMEGDVLRNRGKPCRCTISIHSLRMEGDGMAFLFCDAGRYFNPLPPHGGRPVTEKEGL